MRRKYLVHPSLQKKQNPQSNNLQQTPLSSQNPPIEPKMLESPIKNEKKITNVPTKFDNVRKFPRPLISQEVSKTRHSHNSNKNFEDPPSTLYEFQTEEEGNATCRHARSSLYLIADNSKNLSKSKINFSVVFTPLAENSDFDTPVPYADKRENSILRCDRCGSFVNPFYVFKDGMKKFVCNICEFEGSVPPGYLQNNELSKENFPENFNSVYDFIVPDNYKLNDIDSNNILICFDMSLQSIMNGSFNHIINSVKNLLGYLEEDTHIGFILYDEVVSFLRIYEEDQEISILRSCDKQKPVSPLSFNEIFHNAKNKSEIILKILEFLEALALQQYEEQSVELSNNAHCLETLSRTLKDLFSEKGGRAIICTSIHKIKGNETVKYPTSEKIPIFKPKVSTFAELGSQLAEKSVTIDLFITTDKNFELPTISPLSLNTGGTVYFYPNFKIHNYSDKLYYDLYRSITVQRGFDIACRLRSSQGIQILNYITPKGKVHTLDFRMPSISADQHIIAQMQLGENLKNQKKVYLQFVTLYTNSYDTRLMRIINLSLKVTNDMPLFYKNMDCEAFSYSFLRNEIDKLFRKSPKDVNEEILQETVKLFRYYRNEVGGNYESREFALPDRLKYFPLYLSSVLHQPCLNYKNSKNNDFNYYTLLNLIQLNMTRSFYLYYPKLFDISELFKEWSENPESIEGGGDIDGVTVLLDSIPSLSSLLKNDSVFLIDNGIFLYLYIQNGVDPNLLGHLFGVTNFDEGVPTAIASVDSDFNLRVNAIVERLRNGKSGALQPMLIITEQDENTERLRSCFIESCDTVFSKNYWDFLSQLHDRVKDE